MASNTAVFGLNGLPDPATQRVERDRALALAHVRGASVADIVAESGINYRTVYRAIEREREWAMTHKDETPSGDSGRG